MDNQRRIDAHDRDPEQDTIVAGNASLDADRGVTVPAVVGTFHFTVIGARGIKRELNWQFPKTYIVVENGKQVYRTRSADSLQQPFWNETFEFTAPGAKDITITLYKSSLLPGRPGTPLGRISERLIDLQRNTGLSSSGTCALPLRTLMNSPSDEVPVMSWWGTIRRAFEFTSKLRPTVVDVVAEETKWSCPVYALIIGIDKYKSEDIDDLQGSVHDAKAMHAYLTEWLHVPEKQMTMLTDEMATREAILKAIHSLTNDDRINEGDPIIIFYAGHGSRIECPKGLTSVDGRIETLVPHDERMKDANGDDIHGIPDRTINHLLRELAAAKGDNITVIMDSCHAGGLARSAGKQAIKNSCQTIVREGGRSAQRARCVKTTTPIPEDLDHAILSSGRALRTKLPPGFRHAYTKSHVVIAACKQEEKAHECETAEGSIGGAFTERLIEKLKELTLRKVTYCGLLDSLPELMNQHPQCEGFNKNRILFDGKVIGHDPATFKLVASKGGYFQVEAGSVHGVITGTEFAVQVPSPEPSTSKTLGILEATAVIPHMSNLARRVGDQEFEVPQGARASISDYKDDSSLLKILISSEDHEERLKKALSPERLAEMCPKERRQFVQVGDRSRADITLSRDSEGIIKIERLDSLIRRYATDVVKVESVKMLDHLPSMLDAVANFNYHLGRHHPSSELEDKVRIELYRLTKNGVDREPDLKCGNFLDGVVEAIIEQDENAEYGVAIVNESDQALFPYLFYFDPSDYSIDVWYTPPSSSMSAPLPPSKRFTVGYGAGGGDPFEFFLNDDEITDTGFLKLFVSTRYVDLDFIEQEGPSKNLRSRHNRRSKKMEPAVGWGTKMAAITVARQLNDES